jgi:hypothetical protein
MHMYGYLTTLSESRLYSVDDTMINECGAVGGMRTGRGNRRILRKSAPVPFHPMESVRKFSYRVSYLVFSDS